MAEMQTCPKKESILDYLLGKTPGGQMHMLEEHFSRCTECEETLLGITASDTLSGLVESAAQSQTEATAEDQEFLESLINQLQNQSGGSKADRDLNPADGIVWNKRNARTDIESAGEIIRLVTQTDHPDCLGKIGIYHLESVLGSGSTSVVFLAKDPELDRKIALKVLKPSLGKAAKERFIQEAKSVAAIEHPNVVTIYQVGIENELAFIAMKWGPGETLESRFSRVAFLPESEVVQIAKQIAAGLTAAHDQQMIHRDIKPANIWLSDDKDQVTILDFGLARIADDDPHLTQTGVLAGTPNFMSPEQARGIELDSRSDLFGLGCLMYRTATGKLPFEGNGVLSTLQAIQNADPPAAKTLNPHLTSDFSDLVMCLLNKQPANRPRSADELLKAFDQPREQWKFVSSGEERITDRRPLQGSTSYGKSGGGGWTTWIAVAICMAVVGFAGFMMGPDVIRIVTDQGELIIQTEDEDVKIEVLSGGKVVRVIDTQTEQSINFKSGIYEFQVANSKNGFKITPKQIEMTRGGRRVVMISRVDDDSKQDLAKTTVQAENATTPTYDGRTFAQWSEILKTERNPQTIKMGLKAVGELSHEDADLNELAIQVVLPILRKYGSITVTGDKDEIVDEITKFFGYLEPERILQFVLQEVKEGTDASRSHLAWLVTPSAVYGSKPLQISAFRNLVNERIDSLIVAAAGLVKSDKMADVEAGEQLLQASLRTAFGSFNFGFATHDPVGRLSEQVERILKRLMEESRYPREKIFYANLLVQYGRVDEPLIRSIIELVSDDDLSGHVGHVFHFSILNRIPKKSAGPLVVPIVNLIKNEKKMDRIYQATSKRSFGAADVKSIQIGMIHHLVRFGAKSEAALDWLEQEAATSSPLSQQAKAAADKIRIELKKGF